MIHALLFLYRYAYILFYWSIRPWHGVDLKLDICMKCVHISNIPKEISHWKEPMGGWYFWLSSSSNSYYMSSSGWYPWFKWVLITVLSFLFETDIFIEVWTIVSIYFFGENHITSLLSWKNLIHGENQLVSFPLACN